VASLERRFSLFEVGASGSAPAAVSGSGRKRARVEIAAEREAMIEAACIEYKCGVQKLRGLYVLGKAKVSGLSAATKRLEPENRCKRCNEKMHDCIVLTENGDKYGGSIGPILPTANGATSLAIVDVTLWTQPPNYLFSAISYLSASCILTTSSQKSAALESESHKNRSHASEIRLGTLL